MGACARRSAPVTSLPEKIATTSPPPASSEPVPSKGNEEIFKRILDDGEFRSAILEYYAARLYERLRADDDQLGLAPA